MRFWVRELNYPAGAPPKLVLLGWGFFCPQITDSLRGEIYPFIVGRRGRGGDRVGLDGTQAAANGNAVEGEGYGTTPPKQNQLGWGTRAIPLLGNAVSALTLGWDGYQAYKKYQSCMAGH